MNSTISHKNHTAPILCLPNLFSPVEYNLKKPTPNGQPDMI